MKKIMRFIFGFFSRESILHAHAFAFKISLWINKTYVLSMKQALFFVLECIKGVSQYIFWKT